VVRRRNAGEQALLWLTWASALCASLLLATTATAAEPAYRWKSAAQSANVSVGDDLLTADERAYLAALPEIRVALDKNTAAPYENVAANGEVSGYQVDMLLSLARIFNLKLRPVVFDEWPQVLDAVKQREADMVLTSTVTPDRLNYIAYTLGTVPVPSAVFGRADVANPAAVTQARFAVEREYAANDTVRRRFAQATIVPVATSAEALRAVHDGRADYYVGSILETTDTLARENMQGIELRFALPIGSGFYHLGVRKDWSRLATILNRGISSLRTTGAPDIGEAVARVLGAGAAVEPLTLSRDATQWLAQTSVLRAGAVRGLALLNDVGPDGSHTGVAADYLDHVVQRLGVGVEVVPFDSVADMLAALREQRIHLVPFLAKTAQREREFRYSAPYLTMPFVLVARSDAPAYWDLSSLRGRRVALAAEHPLRPVITERYPEIQMVGAANGSEAMTLVADGRADAAVEVKIFANLRVNDGGGGHLRTLSEIAEAPAAFHFALAPAAGALLPAIDQSLADIAPGERERMLRRWVAVDVVPGFAWRRWGPAMAVAATALLGLVAATLWWMRRLSRESVRCQRALELVEDVGRVVPGCVYRYELDARQQVVRTFMSSGSEAFLGVPIPPGQTLHEVCRPHVDAELHPAMVRELREAMTSGQRYERTFPYHHPDGRELWLYTEAVRSRTPAGNTIWTGYVIDVTQRQLMQQHIERESDERYLMLASASHELRAPAHTLLLALQSLTDRAVDAGGRGTIGIAREAARTLVQLLDEVLDMARTRYGRIELRPQQVNLHALFEQVADAQAGLIEEKGLRFVRRIEPGVPRTVSADPLRLKQVLTNVLNNAAKYTERGSIEFSLRVVEQAAGGAMLRFVVEDTGIGIDAEMRERLFKPFAARRDGALGAGLRSTGLGLAHCQRLLALMKGTLDIDSQPGHGTRVTIGVPLPAQTPTQTPTPTHAAVRRSGAILVCDDDTVSGTLLAEMLRSDGHAVVVVDNVAAALERWRLGDIRAVISDLNMPTAGGNELVKRLRAEERATPDARAARTVLVICSGDPAPPQTDHAPPFDAFISKPVDMRSFSDTLSALGIEAPAAVAPRES
jgi:two-component system, NarL family, sensor histidine kinase EvgS